MSDKLLKDATKIEIADELQRRLELAPQLRASTFVIAFGKSETEFCAFLGGHSDCTDKMILRLAEERREALTDTNSKYRRLVPN